MTAYLVIVTAANIVSGLVWGGRAEEIDPLVMLALLSAVFLVLLLYNKKKYGD